jgi:hypothetical protein
MKLTRGRHTGNLSIFDVEIVLTEARDAGHSETVLDSGGSSGLTCPGGDVEATIRGDLTIR